MNAGLIPIKSPAQAKRRLAEALDPAAHQDLTLALLEDALEFCSQVKTVRWWVVSDDEGVRTRAQILGFEALADTGRSLNSALRSGIAAVGREGADAVMVVPGDVPLAQPEDAQDILDTGATSDVVVVPASDGGTNGLYLSLPGEMEPAFGPESLRVHVEAAAGHGLRCTILDLPRLAIDLDTPEDARALLEAPTGTGGRRTLEVLGRHFDRHLG